MAPKKPPPSQGKAREESAKRPCVFCLREFSLRGVKTHERACPNRPEAGMQAYQEILLMQRKQDSLVLSPTEDPNESNLNPVERLTQDSIARSTSESTSQKRLQNQRHENQQVTIEVFDEQDGEELDPDPAPGIGVSGSAEQHMENHIPTEDEIKIEYHPQSGRASEYFEFNEYKGTLPESLAEEIIDPEPWKPFRTRLDFEIAELMLDAHMNERQKSSMISLIRQCIQDPDSFTISGTKELDKIWNFARSYKATGFEKVEIKAEYKHEDIVLDVWRRPLWNWCCDLLLDRDIVSQFHWDAERHYKFNGETYERFIDEPWTADAWWDIQSSLPPNAKPICLIIYADKTRLSSFGTQKGYPVIARCANLPVEMRNGKGVAGGRLVGWLPILEEDSAETGKTAYINLKRVIWHEALYEILRSLEDIVKLGYKLNCGDDILRWLFVFILILSADFEEQSMISLTRGTGSNFPCPVCLIPGDQLTNLSQNFELRTTKTMMQAFNTAQEMETAAEREEYLKSFGLRNVQNVFWKFNGTDVYDALSWDRLHAYHGGLFSKHLLVVAKQILEKKLPRKDTVSVDTILANVPPWSGLNHFTSISKSGEFSDGTKHEDLSKVIVYACHSVFSPRNCPEGFLLLKLIRSYLELDMYASLTVHTEGTIAAGEDELLMFESLLQIYEEQYPGKSWNFPKAHTHKHLFRDILRKGVTRNFNTKYNEKDHGPLKITYKFNTNFKEVSPQLLKVNEQDLCSIIIRTGISALDDHASATPEDLEDINDKKHRKSKLIGSEHVSLGSAKPAISVADLQTENMQNPIFENFRRKLNKFLTKINGKNTRVDTQTKVTPYQYMKINYESMIDWRQTTNILRANPNFYNRPRYDFILFKVSETEQMFAQLQYIFGISVDNQTHYMALILPMDSKLTVVNNTRDRELRLTRVRAREKASTVIISTESIIRGCLLVDDDSSPSADEYLVVNFIDEDMWWRLKTVNLPAKLPVDL